MNTRLPSSRLALALVFALFAAALPAEEVGNTGIPPGILKKYDQNKDGALDPAERAKWESDKAANREKERARRAEMLANYDTDKDGRLSEEEKATAKLEREKAKSEREAEKMKERAERQRAEKAKAEALAAGSPASAGEETGAAEGRDASGEVKPKGKVPEGGKTAPGETMMME